MTKTILSLVLVGGAIALFFFYTKPTYDSLTALQQKITQYNLALDKAAELQRLKQSLLTRYNSFNPVDIEKLHKLLPDHVDNVRLVLDLDTLASKHGLALQNVVVSAASDTDAANSEAIIGPSLEDFGAITLHFATTGPYDRFVEFLTDLERSLRVVDIVELKMDPTQGTGSETNYRYDITLRTYWLK